MTVLELAGATHLSAWAGAALTFGYIRAATVLQRRRLRAAERRCEALGRDLGDVAHAYDCGVLAGKVQRQVEGPGSRPRFYPSDDLVTLASRRGVQDGWQAADGGLSSAEGIEAVVERWREEAC